VNGELGMKTGTLPSGIHVLANPNGQYEIPPVVRVQ
jgi:hypothetical protein